MTTAGHEGLLNEGRSKERNDNHRSLVQTNNYRVVVVGPVEQVVVNPCNNIKPVIISVYTNNAVFST